MSSDYGGKIIIVVPHEVWTRTRKDDICMHLFTWAPQNLHNLCKACGLEVEKSERICLQWMPHFELVQKIFGWKLFRILCYFSCLIGKEYQNRCIAIRRE